MKLLLVTEKSFGIEVQRREGIPHMWLEGVPGLPRPYWVLAPVPEAKTVKDRVHRDVVFEDTCVDGLVAVGATLLRPADDEIRWTVPADPDGNEFCAFAPADRT